MNTRHVAALVSGLFVCISAVADQPAPLDPVSRTILNVRLSAAVLVTFGEQGGRFPPPYPSLVSVDRFAPALGAELRRELVPRDGWGEPLRMILADPETFLLISFGADGTPDFDYMKVWESGGGGSDGEAVDPSSPDRDIVFSHGEFIQRPRAPESAANRALADMRSIGTAIESFAVDNDAYPGPTAGLATIESLSDALEPIYIGSLPRVDPWGRPYLVCADGRSYALVSSGADGLLDLEYADVPSIVSALGAPRTSTDEGDDIVFVDGRFVRWPEAVNDDRDPPR